MPPALDRLLARPSSLRLLRALVDAPALPAPCCLAAHCCRSKAPRRTYSADSRLPALHSQSRTPERPRSPTQPARIKKHVSGPPRAADDSRRDNTLKRVGIGHIADLHDDAVWAQLVQYLERVQGPVGVRNIWFARHGYNLPTNDTPEAETLWGTFLKHPELVLKVIDHAAHLRAESGQVYPRLYELCMEHWLPRHTDRAVEYHHRLVVKLQLRRLPLKHLSRMARSRFTAKSFETFMEIYRTSNERDIYDFIVPALCDQGKFALARRWHNLCVFRNDMPSPSVASQPIVQLFFTESSTMSNPEIWASGERILRQNVMTESNSPISKPRYNEELTRRLLGRDTAPVRFEDSFCARMFATKAIPADSIIKGLAMVGVNEIGPQALLAMAVKANSIGDLPQRFEELKAAGITLQGCVFSLALEKFTMEGNWRLVRCMLESDQHPDVFDDPKVQEKLLDYYLEQGRTDESHRTLAVLTLFHNDSAAESWNLLLQAHIRHLDPSGLVQVLQDMRRQSIMVNMEAMVMIKTILRPRHRGRKPTESGGKFDDVRFVARVYTLILEGGIGMVPPIAWREILRRYGMLGRYRELRRLIFWLLCWYAPRSHNTFTNLPKSTFVDAATQKLRAAYPERSHYFHWPAAVTQENPGHPLRRLFRNSFQQGLIIWGFKAGLLPNAALEQSMVSSSAATNRKRRSLLKKGILKRLNWHVGLQTLVELRDLGIHVHRHTVIKTLQMQLVVLFGRGRSRKKENRVMEDVNPIPYGEYVREVNRIWGTPLFAEPQLWGKSRLHGWMWHPRLERRVRRRTSVRIGEVVGPAWRRVSAADDGHQYERVGDEPDHQETSAGQEWGVDGEGQDSMSSMEELERAAAAARARRR
ncbi:hypothetical protein BDV95DRAFT_582160 [Massariosphaeria phaeospora]|uniref:Pentatricopeptide repeat domain-containing protein n=1 Tax=Massariosphaeria phaeospora TaxID=100035 RepID=A0A7C8M3M0_9PLEO|nr:hypothetical protein BDV95DRAFT_582160 [Massariosphaeria phaeospora]